MLLTGDINASVTIASTENFGTCNGVSAGSQNAPFAELACSTRLDPIAPIENRPDGEDAAREVASLLHAVQSSFGGKVRLCVSRNNVSPRGIVAQVDVPLATSIGELRRLFSEGVPSVLDVANTNKCLVYVGYPFDVEVAGDGRCVRVTAVIDNLLKGAAGNAVHCLNLLFGLSERTGLALKASAF